MKTLKDDLSEGAHTVTLGPRCDDVTQADSRDADLAAAKRFLWHIRETLECLTRDVINFRDALDGPPGTLAELVLDTEVPTG